MSLRNAFGLLALDSTVSAIKTYLDNRLGSKTTANSIAVSVASDQTVPVSATALPLPTGAATAANQSTANTSLSSIDGKLPALSGGNVPVVPAVQLGTGVATATTQRVTLATDGAAVTALTSIAGLAIPAHDYIALSYTGSNLTGVTYRTGGATGTIVGTLTLAYSGSNLTSVTKS